MDWQREVPWMRCCWRRTSSSPCASIGDGSEVWMSDEVRRSWSLPREGNVLSRWIDHGECTGSTSILNLVYSPLFSPVPPMLLAKSHLHGWPKSAEISYGISAGLSRSVPEADWPRPTLAHRLWPSCTCRLRPTLPRLLWPNGW